MAVPVVTTVNRRDKAPLAPTFSDLSIISIPAAKPAVHLLRTAGQVGTPAPATPPAPIPTSFLEQAQNAFANVAACLALGGAVPRDITKITVYVVNYDMTMREELIQVITEFFRPTRDEKPHKPPSTLLGVEALASKEFLIEVEAEAAILALPEGPGVATERENAENTEMCGRA